MTRAKARGILKWIPVIFLTFTFLLALAITQASDASTTVSIGNLSSAPGETITAPILICDVENYGTGTINITYDPVVVHVTGVSNGPESTVTAWDANNTMGFVRISAWNIGGVSGDIIFANVTFHTVGSAGSTPLDISVTTLKDIHYADIPVMIRNGSFSIKPNIVDTGEGTYPSIFGTHNGTITPNKDISMNRIYTYLCTGTGGHTEYAKMWNETEGECAVANWKGYIGDWHNISFNRTLTLKNGVIYNYTIRTGSYPQVHHTNALPTANGWINCSSFIDANGKRYDNWIPAIKLFYEE